MKSDKYPLGVPFGSHPPPGRKVFPNRRSLAPPSEGSLGRGPLK